MKLASEMKALLHARTVLALALLPVVMAAHSAQAQTLSVLYSFTGGADGSQPYSSLVMDHQGNLYGTTAVGGNGNGVVFKVDTSANETVLYTFQGGTDGANPWAGLVRDSAGNLYGTTEAGGTAGFGTVFKLNKAGTKKTALYNFTGTGNDGAYTFARLIRDAKGTLYGTTYKGGANGDGTVFKLSRTGKETVLYSFQGGSDGQNPYAGVIRDPSGNLYGTTFGTFGPNYGTVYRVSKTGKEKVLHAFGGGSDGGAPEYGGLVMDKAGNVYGTTSYGGANHYFGVVYKVSKSGKQTVLYSFTGGADGAQPNAGLVMDKAGNLYGTTTGGGANSHGTIFKVTRKGKETVLYSFVGGTDPSVPDANLILDGKGNLYGTSIEGGAYGAGTVFRLTP